MTNYPPTIRSIRNFVEERTSTSRDALTEDLRDIKVLFGSLDLEDDRSNKSTPSDSMTESNSPEWIHPNYISAYTTGTEQHTNTGTPYQNRMRQVPNQQKQRLTSTNRSSRSQPHTHASTPCRKCDENATMTMS